MYKDTAVFAKKNVRNFLRKNVRSFCNAKNDSTLDFIGTRRLNKSMTGNSLKPTMFFFTAGPPWLMIIFQFPYGHAILPLLGTVMLKHFI